MLAVLAITFYFLFRDTDLQEILRIVRAADWRYVTLGFVFMFTQQGLYTVVLAKLLTGTLKTRLPFSISIYTSFIGYYFNNITPSASGGQPVQVYYLYRRGVNIPSSSVMFILQALLVYSTTLFLTVVAIILRPGLVFTAMGHYNLLFAFGVIFALTMLYICFFLLYRPGVLRKSARWLERVLVRLRLMRHPEKFRAKAEQQIDIYSDSSFNILRNTKLLLSLFGLTLLQHIFYYLIPWAAARSLNVGADRFVDIFCLQSVLNLAVSGFPTPGSVGMTEGGFRTIFQAVLPEGMALPTMLVTRFINFYAFLVLSMIITAIAFIRVNRSRQFTVDLPDQPQSDHLPDEPKSDDLPDNKPQSDDLPDL